MEQSYSRMCVLQHKTFQVNWILPQFTEKSFTQKKINQMSFTLENVGAMSIGKNKIQKPWKQEWVSLFLF